MIQEILIMTLVRFIYMVGIFSLSFVVQKKLLSKRSIRHTQLSFIPVKLVNKILNK